MTFDVSLKEGEYMSRVGCTVSRGNIEKSTEEKGLFTTHGYRPQEAIFGGLASGPGRFYSFARDCAFMEMTKKGLLIRLLASRIRSFTCPMVQRKCIFLRGAPNESLAVHCRGCC